jgi:hypothetical protein
MVAHIMESSLKTISKEKENIIGLMEDSMMDLG